jgi:succinate dehydrogenase/fumarate reductase flavoprotein subunit
MLQAGEYLNYPELARTVANQSNDTVEWTMKRVGAQYKEQINMMGGHSVPRTLQTANGHGSEVVGKQIEALKKVGVEISFHHALSQLYRDQSGQVVGIEVREGYEIDKPGGGTVKTIKARKGIVLATGGFSADIHFRLVQNPRLTADYKSTNQPGATAESLIAALRIDAAPVQLDEIQLIPLTSPDDEGLGDGCGFIAGSGMTHGVLVDPATGKRFVSELADRKIQANAIIATGHPAINISDAHGAQFAWWGLEKSVAKGTVKRFDTLEALATA